MNYEVFITAAVTGSGDTVSKSDKVPVTPKEIAAAAIESAKAGAAIAHCHVRDPETGAPARKVEYYREVVERIREADTDVVINLTAGMGGDLTLGPVEQPLPPLPKGGVQALGPPWLLIVVIFVLAWTFRRVQALELGAGAHRDDPADAPTHAAAAAVSPTRIGRGKPASLRGCRLLPTTTT